MNFDLNYNMGTAEEDLRAQLNWTRGMIDEVIENRRHKQHQRFHKYANQSTLQGFSQHLGVHLGEPKVPVTPMPPTTILANFIYAMIGNYGWPGYQMGMPSALYVGFFPNKGFQMPQGDLAQQFPGCVPYLGGPSVWPMQQQLQPQGIIQNVPANEPVREVVAESMQDPWGPSRVTGPTDHKFPEWDHPSDVHRDCKYPEEAIMKNTKTVEKK